MVTDFLDFRLARSLDSISVTWCASSRVGTTMSPDSFTLDCDARSASSIRDSKGSRYACVLPLPAGPRNQRTQQQAGDAASSFSDKTHSLLEFLLAAAPVSLKMRASREGFSKSAGNAAICTAVGFTKPFFGNLPCTSQCTPSFANDGFSKASAAGGEAWETEGARISREPSPATLARACNTAVPAPFLKNFHSGISQK